MPDFRRILLGRQLASDETQHTKISNPIGLAVFSSDALSSVAYATQEIMASLSMALGHGGAAVAAGVAATALFGLSVPVALGIVILLVMLAFSYRQTIIEYPGGGGAYIVAKENLGELAAQTAGASLLIDYVLTVAVSVSSGIAAITAAVPGLNGYNVLLTLAAIAFIAMANLRGVKESGRLFAIPTYGFITCMMVLLAIGFGRWIFGAPVLPDPNAAQMHFATGHVSRLAGLTFIWIFMRAYSAGCTALTGVEAISNGVTAFKAPSGKNAAKTMVSMVLLLGIMFMGITLLAHHFGVTYQHSADATLVQETLLSKLTRQILGHAGVLSLPAKVYYYMIQGFTFAILVVAANTAYADFPRLAALHAGDGFLPRQFTSMGDRLVFSNGIMILSVLSGALVFCFHANTDILLPLYALGVFLGFTISQAGMVVHWYKKRGRHWQAKSVVNGLGGIASGVVMLDIAITKFAGGAWIVIALVPILVTIFFNIHRHYIRVKSTLAASRTDAYLPTEHHSMILVSSLHAGLVQAVAYAKNISGDRVEAITVDMGSDGLEESAHILRLRSDWVHYGDGVPLRSVPSPYRRIVEPIIEEVERFRLAEPDVCLSVILPEFVSAKWWHRSLHNQMAFRIKHQLRLHPGVVVASVRMHLQD